MEIEERNTLMFDDRMFNRMTYKEIGEKYGVSTNRARQIIQHRYRVLKHSLSIRRRYIPELKNRIQELKDELVKSKYIINKASSNESFIFIDDLDLSNRTRNCLKNMGITTLNEASLLKDYDFLAWPNFGKKSLNELRYLIKANGL